MPKLESNSQRANDYLNPKGINGAPPEPQQQGVINVTQSATFVTGTEYSTGSAALLVPIPPGSCITDLQMHLPVLSASQGTVEGICRVLKRNADGDYTTLSVNGSSINHNITDITAANVNNVDMTDLPVALREWRCDDDNYFVAFLFGSTATPTSDYKVTVAVTYGEAHLT